MVTQEGETVVPATPSAEVIGNAFVQQYYHVLHNSPGVASRFYHDSSLLSRPDPHLGVMKTVTTMQAINDMITSLNYEKIQPEIDTADSQESHERGAINDMITSLNYEKIQPEIDTADSQESHERGVLVLAINDMITSLNYDEFQPEIDTVDSQESHERGVLVLVTGCLTGKDNNVQKKFTQSFFLAPQDKGGFFVRNDVLQFVKEKKPFDVDAGMENDTQESALMASLTVDPVAAYIPDEHPIDSTTSVEEKEEYVIDRGVVEDIKDKEVDEDVKNGAEDDIKHDREVDVTEICEPPNNERSVNDEEVVELANHLDQNETAVDSVLATQDDAPKKSYASIVKATRSSKPLSTSIHVPVSSSPAAINPDQRFLGSTKPAPKTAALPPLIETPPDINNGQNREAEGHSIYIRNLPLSATVEQVEEAFKKFGPIKRRGVQVRINKGFCFGFVEFESSNSMQNAIEATPIIIGDHKVDIEEKKTTWRGGSDGRGGYRNFGRGGIRNDHFREGGAKISGGRGFGRNDYRNEVEFTGRPTRSASTTGRNGNVYQRVTHNE